VNCTCFFSFSGLENIESRMAFFVYLCFMIFFNFDDYDLEWIDCF